MEDISIYIHIPFCERKCTYCAFNSFCASYEEREYYINLLCKEIERRKCDRPVKTIYIGGGTPSILSPEQIEKIVKTVYDNFNVYDNAEFTIEANPNSITEELVSKWKSLRVNRVSVGVQSLSDRTLKKIGRLHTKQMALDKIKLLRKQFANVSADLIVGLEGEDGKTLCKYASQLLDLGVKHISCYLLEVYENTKMYSMIENKSFVPLDDGEMVSAFNKLSTYLVDKEMERYEISNFAIEGFESKHNLNYWNRGDYLGFGLSAHSLIGDKRYKNPDLIADYEQEKVEVEELSIKEQIEEIIMLGLRCKLGVDLDKVRQLGYDITSNKFYNDYVKEKILRVENGRLYLNPVFYHISNTIISNLFE